MKEVEANVGAQGAALLQLEHVGKVYGNKDAVTNALNDVSFTVAPGEFVAIMGPSGSGKSTLLNCISTIDTVTSGKIMLAGQDITRMRGSALAKFRRDELGFIFQDSNLLDTLTGFENIALALTLKSRPAQEIRAAVHAMAHTLGVEEVLQKFPQQMSGGQRQRVAAARAMITNPRLVLADEPTGALDSRSSTVLLETLRGMNQQMGATIMMVTHDAYAASYSTRAIFIRDGRLFNEVRRGASDQAEYYQRIMDVVSFLGGELTDAR